jgi:MFS family permease
MGIAEERRMRAAESSGGTAGAHPPGDLAKGVVPLLALALFINYVDRGNLATAAPLIQANLKLSTTQIGFLISAFFWIYVPGQIFAGWLAERINPYRTLALGLGLWSAATAATGLASGFAALLGLRILLGLGESAIFPCSSKLFAQHLPPKRLGHANGMVGTGLALGPAFSTLVGGLLMARIGWQAVFLLFGLISLLWLIPWQMVTGAASRQADTIASTPAPSFLAILRERSAWGAFLGHFSSNYALYFVLSWLPLYLVKARGFSLSQMAELGGAIYLIYALSCYTVGRVSDHWMQQGASDTKVRKSFSIAAHLGVPTCMLICAAGNSAAAIASLLVAGVFLGCSTPTLYAIGQTLAGPRAGGKWVALQNFFGNIAGIVGPLITGFLVDRTGDFTVAFAVSASVGLTGLVGWCVLIRRVAPIDWSTAGGETALAAARL